MSAVVCTLFEGNYHHGVAALVNSLYHHGFRGTVYAGYKGSLPPWVEKTKQALFAENLKAEEFLVTEGLSIIFVKLDTDYHLTNYKPAFMLQVVGSLNYDIDSIFYFDPDIVVKCNWSFFEKWVKYGVAVVNEIIWNDMPVNHPKRKMWEEVAINAGMKVENRLISYVNAGFLGLSESNFSFLGTWKKLIEHCIDSLGMDESKFTQTGRISELFEGADQDLFNLSLMCTELPISNVGPDAMDFIYGGWLMSHSTGQTKPWLKNYVTSFLNGYPPTLQDKEFWKYSSGVIKSLSINRVRTAYFLMKVTSLLGRLYRRY